MKLVSYEKEKDGTISFEWKRRKMQNTLAYLGAQANAICKIEGCSPKRTVIVAYADNPLKNNSYVSPKGKLRFYKSKFF